MLRLRTLLVLGRISNLPTVWSNCLAGWWLGGGGNFYKIPWLLAGTSLLYVGGMFLNDAFDAEFDLQRRKERPIPRGAIRILEVWSLGFIFIAMGSAALFAPGNQTGLLGCALAFCIVLYDAIHKIITFSPVLMGICRFLVYIVAASTGLSGVTGHSIWCALALGFYVTGLSFIARRESIRERLPRWPLILIVIPILLALIMNAGSYRIAALLISAVLLLWILLSFLASLVTPPRPGRTVSGLLAGIIIVDFLAACDVLTAAPETVRFGAIAFFALFGIALLAQRFVPAT